MFDAAAVPDRPNGTVAGSRNCVHAAPFFRHNPPADPPAVLDTPARITREPPAVRPTARATTSLLKALPLSSTHAAVGPASGLAEENTPPKPVFWPRLEAPTYSVDGPVASTGRPMSKVTASPVVMSAAAGLTGACRADRPPSGVTMRR
jgi:hypothetical protein